MTIDELKMKVIDLEWAVMEKNSVDRRYFQQEIFDEIDNLHVMLQASEADRDSWRQRCEMLARKNRMLEEASVSHLSRMANIYGESHAKPMDPMPEHIVHKDETSIYPENVNEMKAHPSPDEPDDPLPFWDLDHEDIAPAEEVEGSDE